MGYALIVGGGTNGRYTISLDIGEAERAALVARFTTAQAAAQDKLAAAQAELNTKTAELDAATTAYNDATILYIELLRNEAVVEDEDAYLEIVKGYFEAQATYLRARAAHSAALANRNALSFSASHLTKALAAWQAQVLTETREAWCTDYTEDATGYVATLEIPGESDLILIDAGGRSPVLATDGYLRSRGLMAPWQAYFNAAILPGWQKFKPTYRWGTITALDEDADTATVSLAEARSSAQHLLVNQETTLSNVPVLYMECNAEAFSVGDRVVVEFQNQDLGSPRVIGFLDNPVPCVEWPIVKISASLISTEGTGGGTRSWIDAYVNDVLCGMGVSGWHYKTIGPGLNWKLSYGNAAFVYEPEEAFLIDADIPADTELGFFSGHVLLTQAPFGDSPADMLTVAASSNPNNFRLNKNSWSFSSVTWPVWEIIDGEDGPYCVQTDSVVGDMINGQEESETYIEARVSKSSNSVFFDGAIVDLAGLPVVSVSINGVTKVYQLWYCSGLDVFFKK